MYRILIADDEGIMLESLKDIITKEFGDEIEVATAKSGRGAIEQAESFHPDIAFMDIQMPGINGISAIREIRMFNSSCLFYVISAYNKFDYAKEAISLGVEKYLMKPISRRTVVETIEEAMAKVNQIREKRSVQLKIQEKLETVIPVVETGFVSNMLLADDVQDEEYYRQLLEVTEDYAYVEVIQYGTRLEDGKLFSPVETRVKAQDNYMKIRAIIKSFQRCIVGPVMSDRIVLVVPHRDETISYEERIEAIDRVHEMLMRLEENLELKFRTGIGRICRLKDLRMSYQGAVLALQNSRSRVAHTDDLTRHGVYEDDYPIELERDALEALSKGDVEGMRRRWEEFFDWMYQKDPGDLDSMRLKVLELVLRAEFDAFAAGSVNYAYNYRKDYLTQVNALADAEQIRSWFLEKMIALASGIRDRNEEQSESTVKRAQKYIQENYQSDISLDEVSREVNVSPYYFSKLFKEEVGENFIEYLTALRISKAKEYLKDPSLPIREAGSLSGYADSNYFSRIFKKQTGMTPREYREKNS